MYEIVRARKRHESGIRSLIAQNPGTLLQEDVPHRKSFFVVEGEHGEVLGCCALVVYSKRLAEVRSLAVDKRFRKKGLGLKLVAACEALAREKGVRELLAITSSQRFFEEGGFHTFRGEKLAMLKPLNEEK